MPTEPATAAVDDPDDVSIGAVIGRRRPDDVLVVTSHGDDLTAADCLERSATLARELVGHGVRRGDRVAVLHDLSADALLLWWAISRLGAVYVPLNPTWRPRLAGRVVAARAPTVVLAEPRHRAVADAAATGTAARVLPVPRGSAAAGDGFRDAPAAPLDDCCIVHNSGRPGIEHGVRGSWRQFAVMGGNMAAMHPAGRTLVAAPPCFMGVLLTVYGALASGGSVALLQGLTAETFWPEVHRTGLTSAAMLNPTLADVLARPVTPHDRDHPLRMMIGNASEADRNAEAGRRFGVHWLAGLGKTEVCGAVATDLDPAPSDGVGRVRAPFVGRLVDPLTGVTVPAGDAGELVLRCGIDGGLPAGYADDPAATAELWRDGWLHTGWHLREDDAGNLHPVGINSIDPIVIKRAGYMFAADLEREIVAAVDGVTGARVGTRPPATDLGDPVVVAWVIGGPLQQTTVTAQLRAGLPAHLVPDLVVPVDALPTDAEAAEIPATAWGAAAA